MAIFDSVNQNISHQTKMLGTPLKKREHDIEYYDEEFPYIIINNAFNEKELKLVWEELDFLCYDWKDFSAMNPQTAGKWDRNLTSRHEVFLQNLYASPYASSIIKQYLDCFTNTGFKTIFKNHPSHWFFKKQMTIGVNYLINYYENSNYYKPHKDQGFFTGLHWFFREPKKFEGGEFIFSDYDKKIKVENNKMLIFPSQILHEVTPVKMEAEDVGKKLGRWSITSFFNQDEKSLIAPIFD